MPTHREFPWEHDERERRRRQGRATVVVRETPAGVRDRDVGVGVTRVLAVLMWLLMFGVALGVAGAVAVALLSSVR